MKHPKRPIAFVLTLIMVLLLCCVDAWAKTTPTGQTVGTVLFYVTNSAGEQILVSQILVSEMDADMEAGKTGTTNHNYSVLDHFITTVHQEAQGFTVPEFVAYAQSKSTVPAIKNLSLTFEGQDEIRFWEIDQTGYDDLDTYTYGDLYGAARYNFPLLYQYWNYKTQDYSDPAGALTRDQVIDYIFANGEPETVLLAVRAFSQRYMITNSKYGSGDYSMENYWLDSGVMDTERAIRIMKPMTKDELYSKALTASDSRYWVSRILLQMDKACDYTALGTVAAPTAVMTEDDNYYYIRFNCVTEGAVIYYNHNYKNSSYTPTAAYDGTAVQIPKSVFKYGTVTMRAQAVKDGYQDAGVVTLNLTSSGAEKAWSNPYRDVAKNGWYYSYVEYVMKNGLFDATTATTFSPDAPMTRAMLVEALYRLAGSPVVEVSNMFTDVPSTVSYAKAVAWANEKGIVNGVGNNRFAPSDTITREQIAAMFYRYADCMGADLTVSNDLSSYNDKGAVSAWATEYMRWAVGAGLINGTTDTTITPQGTATRAQTAAMVMRLVNFK